MSASSSSAACSCAAIASACRARREPASVGVTPEEERSSSCVPTSFSSAARCWETAGWVQPSSRAPAPIEPLRTTVRKMRSLRGSMTVMVSGSGKPGL